MTSESLGMLLLQDQVVVLTNRCIMKLRAPGFAQVHRAAEQGAVSTSLADLPPAEVRWAIPWQVCEVHTFERCIQHALQGNSLNCSRRRLARLLC